MKLFKQLALAAALVGSVGTANAVPYTWTDAIDGDDHPLPYFSWSEFEFEDRISYTHNIRDGVNGFRPGTDTVSSATLTLALLDDQVWSWSNWGYVNDSQGETFGVRYDNSGWSTSREVDNLADFLFTVTNWVSDGLLNVTIRANSGDFLIRSSTLTVSGDRFTPVNVPEPTTLALFGLGLLGAGFAGRRRAK